MAVEVDDDLLQAVQLAYDSGDAYPGGLLEVAGDGQGGHHYGQVSLVGFTGVVEDGAGSQVVLAHRRRRLRRATARNTRRRAHRHPSDVRGCWRRSP